MVIRHVEAADVVKCFTLWRKLVAEELGTYAGQAAYPSLDLDAPEVRADWFQRFGASLIDSATHFLVAEVDGQVVGFLVAYHYERPIGYPKELIHVGDMYILPEFRKKFRIAAALQTEVEHWAEALKVEVIECNAVATEKQIGRWKRKGFVPYQMTFYRPAKWRGKSDG